MTLYRRSNKFWGMGSIQTVSLKQVQENPTIEKEMGVNEVSWTIEEYISKNIEENIVKSKFQMSFGIDGSTEIVGSNCNDIPT